MQGPCSPNPSLADLDLPDIAIHLLHRFDTMHASLRAAYADYRFHEVAGLLYDFFWGDYCDWFVEAAKPILHSERSEDLAAKEATLATIDVVFSGILRLLHPLMPHITEELWARLGFQAPVSASGVGARAEFLLYTQPPEEHLLAGVPEGKIAAATASTTALYAAVHAVRNLRAEFKIPPKQQVRLLVTPKIAFAHSEQAIFAALTRASEVSLKETAPAGTPSVLTDLGTIYLPLEGLVDLDAERTRHIRWLIMIANEQHHWADTRQVTDTVCKFTL